MNFRNFETSSGKLVLAGKYAKNNEELIVQISPEEDVFHTAKPGSPFVNLKSKNSSSKDIKESDFSRRRKLQILLCPCWKNF